MDDAPDTASPTDDLTNLPAHLAALADEHTWLEGVEDDRALAWVGERNEHAAATVESRSGFTVTRDAIREVLDSPDKIPQVVRRGPWLYNFWVDAQHPRGIWRRTTAESYRTDAPEWQVILDVDALNEIEGEDWVWHGAHVLRPDYRRALVALSHGGSDADVTREFDLDTLEFVSPDDGGFYRAEAKGALSWIDDDTVFVYTDFGAGSLTDSGYPRTVKRWRRGTPLTEADLVYEGLPDDLYIYAAHDHTPGFERDIVSRALAFYSSEEFILEPDGTLRHIDVPTSAEIGLHREWLTIELRDDWTPVEGGVTYRAGSLLAAVLDDFLAGDRSLTELFTPTPTTSLAGATWTRHHLVITVLDDVKHRPEVLTPPEPAIGGADWSRGELAGVSAMGTIAVSAVDSVDSDELWLVTTDFLTPSTLSITIAGGTTAPEPLKASPAFFDGAGLEISQHFATSSDGTRVPYFQVGRAGNDAVGGLSAAGAPGLGAPGVGAPGLGDSQAERRDGPGPRPTLLYGYGGFEISLTPSYSGALGRAWLARGGTYVLANIRGGGEYGPEWHQAALKAKRHRAYEDFEAVARDLVARGVTDPAHLGIQGGSNGGLLTGNMLVRTPELFGAVVIQVPLLDMGRYSRLLAGASWMAEYGDPDDVEQWEFIRSFSPYHLLDPEREYPPVLLTTSTRDDRVHPGHARKFTAKLLAAGKDVTYYENVEGGHGGAADNAQAAHMAALVYEFLAERLGLGS